MSHVVARATVVPAADRRTSDHSHPKAPYRCVGIALVWLLPTCGAWADPAVNAGIADLVTGRASPVATRSVSSLVDRVWIERVYTPAQAAPVWFADAGPRPAVDAALFELRRAGDRGLAPEDYDIGSLERLVEAASASAAAPDAIARADVALTATVLQYLADLRFGRVRPQHVEPNFRAKAKDSAFVSELRDAVARDRIAAMIAAVEPAFPQYARLKRQLAEYRALAAQPAVVLPPLPARPGKVVVGDTYVGAPALRDKLLRLGDLAADSASPVDDRYSEALADAVRRFQARHGLLPDGILGKDTLAALNAPFATRVIQIVLSLERMRWLPAPAPGPLIAINIPSFQLWAFADAANADHPTLTMPVVAGRAMRTETPVFIGEMRYVEFSPYWNVPPSILRNEILPLLARNPAYLEREHMEIVSARRDTPLATADIGASIAALRSGEARLRQRPGPRNALGGVKFVLPNTMDIYLHSTPARELFDRARRDFSHGCIRVREPVALAEFVLRGRPEWTSAQIEAAMTSRANRTVPLSAPIPVVVFYTTAIVDSDARALFLADVYGHDRELLSTLRTAGRSVD
jgi:murein L,D-transpeptidase YcbB/YkuD